MLQPARTSLGLPSVQVSSERAYPCGCGRAGEDDTTLAPYRKEFRNDVVHDAENRESSVTLEQMTKGIGIHSMTLQNRLQRSLIGSLD